MVDFREKKFEGPHCVPFCRSKRVAAERNSGILMLVISCIIYVYYTCKYLKKCLIRNRNIGEQENKKKKRKEKQKKASAINWLSFLQLQVYTKM